MTSPGEPTEDQGSSEAGSEEQLDAVEEQEDGPSGPSKWLWLALIAIVAGILVLLLFNFLHRPPAP